MDSWRTSGSGSHPNLREIRRSDLFDEQGALLAGTIERFDEVMEGIEFLIAREEHPGRLQTGTRLRVFRTDPWEEVPALRVFFTLEPDGSALLV